MLVGPSMDMYKCCQQLLRHPHTFSKSGCRDLELSCDRESSVMPGPQSIPKVSPGLATGISTNTKVNQQPPLVCLPWRTDPISVSNHMWMQAFWRGRTQGWEKGGQQKDLCNKQEWWLAGLFPEEDAVSCNSSALQSCGALPSPSAWLIEFLEASNCLFLLDITIH